MECSPRSGKVPRAECPVELTVGPVAKDPNSTPYFALSNRLDFGHKPNPTPWRALNVPIHSVRTQY